MRKKSLTYRVLAAALSAGLVFFSVPSNAMVTYADETEVSTEAETEEETEAETEEETEAETEEETEAETEEETEAETEEETEASTEAETEASTEAETEPETEASTEAETEPETEVSTEGETEEDTEGTTEESGEASTEETTAEGTEATTEAATQESTEATAGATTPTTAAPVKTIVEVAELEQTVYELGEKPELADLLATFPEKITVTVEDAEGELVEKDLSVKWICDEDYENTEWAYYVFTAQLVSDAYEVSAEMPVIEVYLEPTLKASVFADGLAAEIENSTESEIVLELEKDEPVNEVITIDGGKDVTINLNGHTITFDRPTSYSYFHVKNGSLTLTGEGTVEELDGYAVVYMTGSSTATGAYSSVNVGEDVTLIGDDGILLQYIGKHDCEDDAAMDNSRGMYVDMAGTIKANNAGINVNGNVIGASNIDYAPVINVSGTIDMSGTTKPEKAVGIYQAGYAKTTVSGTVTGTVGGVEVRAGELTVAAGAKIEATSQSFTVTDNGSGSTVKGAGIAVSQHSTDLPIDVQVNGGTIVGYSPIYEVDDNDTEDDINVAINGATLQINGDVAYDEMITIDNDDDVILDLNGHTITFSENAKATVDGSKCANFLVDGGKLSVTGPGTIKDTATYAPIMVRGSKDADTSAYSVVSVEEGVNLEGWAGIFVRQNSNGAGVYGVEIEMNGNITASTDENSNGVGIYVNGTVGPDAANGTKITVGDSAKITSDGHGIFQAGYAVTTVEGGEITGSDTGIEVRAGKLTVEDGKITGGSGSVRCESEQSGTAVYNAGIGVAQHTTKQPIEVTINGGQISGGTAFYQADPEGNNDSANVTLSLAGGEFEDVDTAVYSADKTAFISGGKYNKEPDATYLVTDYVANKDADGWYVVEEKVVLDNGAAVEAVPAGVGVLSGLENETNRAAIEEIINNQAVLNHAPVGLAAAIDTDKIELHEDTVEIEVSVHTGLNAIEGEVVDGAYVPTKLTFEVFTMMEQKNQAGGILYAEPITNDMLNGKKITIYLPIPASVTQTYANIEHHRDNGSIERFYDVQIKGTAPDRYVELQVSDFSPFVMTFSNTKTIKNYSYGSSVGSTRKIQEAKWVLNDKGWWYRNSDGTWPSNTWKLLTWNGQSDWYFFNAEGYMVSGWFNDTDGNRYFLHNVSDGTQGHMYKGWKQIDGVWYYFRENIGGPQGSLMVNGTTPDGYKTDANGACKTYPNK